jgi:hypothetical protein
VERHLHVGHVGLDGGDPLAGRQQPQLGELHEVLDLGRERSVRLAQPARQARDLRQAGGLGEAAVGGDALVVVDDVARG